MIRPRTAWEELQFERAKSGFFACAFGLVLVWAVAVSIRLIAVRHQAEKAGLVIR